MDAIKTLTSAEKFHIELGLSRISRILGLLGNPHKNLKCIHVAGSNGKGSTCAILEEILIKAGYKVGKFTSPHLFSYTERITINKHPISDLDFESIIEKISTLDKIQKIGLTEFEILTAAGFLYFMENSCDIVILEVGLGGRLDSTNIIEHPLASIITSISLEHKERLGDTIEKISKEKAGIIKNGCPVVFLKENKGYKTLLNEAEKKGGVIFETEAIPVKKGFAKLNTGAAEFSLKGAHQGENLALALKTAEILNNKGFNISNEVIKSALKSVRWNFRLQTINYKGNEILIDACHNPDGARVLANYLIEYYNTKRVKFIFGCLKNKDYKEVLDNLQNIFINKNPENCSLCFYEFNYPNALKYKNFTQNISEFNAKIKEIQNPQLEMDDKNFDLVVVFGSIYMLGLVFKDFQDFFAAQNPD